MDIINKLMDFMKLESTKAMEMDYEEKQDNFKTIYFKNGKLYKTYPSDLENWYNARFLISDNKKYDLENLNDIKRMHIPKFKRFENDKYGVTGLLDYVLRMKAGEFFNRNEKQLCSACLWKATEMMFADNLCSWSKRDYIRLVQWHLRLGMNEEAERAQKYLEKKGMIFTAYEAQEKRPTSKNKVSKTVTKNNIVKKEKISSIEKETIIVKNITTEDMRQIEKMPFSCNTDVKKYIHEGNHPMAYMEIIGENIGIVKSEIMKMNSVIEESIKGYPSIPQNLKIPENKLIFEPYNYGYTKIICTPKTFTGKCAKYPYSLYFCTDLANHKNTSHGTLTYGQDGVVKNASVCFWRNSNQFVLNFKTIDNKLIFKDMGQSRPYW